jgi:hypothetical protein
MAYKQPKQTKLALLGNVAKNAAITGIGVGSTATLAETLAPKLTSKLGLNPRRLALGGIAIGGTYAGIKTYNSLKPKKIKVLTTRKS